jgi:hypothetical protein
LLAVLAALLVWIPALLGWGTAARRLFAPAALPDSDETALAVPGFLGLLALSTAGAALHFVVPVGTAASAAAAGIGLVLFAASGRPLIGALSRFDVALLAALLLGLSVLAAGPIRLHDTGLYHLPAVAWFPAGPLPLGLANLHRRFGFDSAWFPAAAFLGLPGIEGSSASVASPLVLFFFGSAVLRSFRTCIAGRPDGSRLLLALGAIPLVILALNEGVPSLSTDLPSTALTILAAHLLLRTPGSPAERGAAVALALYAATVKLSALVFFAGTLLLARTFAWGLAGAAVVWCARGVALSGYLLYPFAASRLGFLWWTLPPRLAEGEIAWARSWARQPGRRPEVVLASWDWFAPWLKGTVLRLSVMPLEALLAVGLVSLALAMRRPPDPGAAGSARRAAAVALIVGSSTVYWFLGAPDPRFGYGALFVLSALPLAAALPRLGWPRWSVGARTALAGLMGAGLAAAGLAFYLGGPGLRAGTLVPAPLPRPVVTPHRTSAGETVRKPDGDDRCWATPVPCTPYFSESLVVSRDAAGRIRGFSYPASLPQ